MRRRTARLDPWGRRCAARRAALLRRLTAGLRADDRFAAAWLIGSLGRGEADAYSDVDLVAVVAPAAEGLCARPWQSAGRTTPERQALIAQFGTPVLVHEAHGNAPANGTHTNILYADGTCLDLTLVPLRTARRPQDARLLFERLAVPAAAPARETLAERREVAAQRVALFWMMALGTARYRLRGWDVAVQGMLVALQGQLADVRRLVAGEPARFRRPATDVRLAPTAAAQGDALRALCDQMEALMPAVERLGVALPAAPRALVEEWLAAPVPSGGR